MRQFLESIIEKLKAPNQESIGLSLNNVHADGLFSLVVGGTEPGKLLRVFIADKKLRPFGVQLHTHRYPIRLTTIRGTIKQYVAKEAASLNASSIKISEYEYRSFLNGGSGLKYLKEVAVNVSEFTLPIGSSLVMDTEEYHTVSCSKGSIWIVEELGFQKECSKVLGIPFTADFLYTKPEMFQINDKCQTVLTELKKIIQQYNSIN